MREKRPSFALALAGGKSVAWTRRAGACEARLLLVLLLQVGRADAVEPTGIVAWMEAAGPRPISVGAELLLAHAACPSPSGGDGGRWRGV